MLFKGIVLGARLLSVGLITIQLSSLSRPATTIAITKKDFHKRLRPQ